MEEKDPHLVWHPFTQMLTAPRPILIERAEGSYLYGTDGKRYLDAISSWWVNLHGHTHPHIVAAIQKQVGALEQVCFANFTHQPAQDLAEKLISLTRGNFKHVFYTDNGSTAVEVALKMALQYWYNENPQTRKKKIIAFNKGYHGDTFGAMAASGKNLFNKPFWSHFFEVEMIDPPFQGYEEASQKQLRNILDKEESACFLYEPLILGAGGMHIYPPEGLERLLTLCKEGEILTIADEVMTGFGRTGTLFASDQMSVKPDLMTLSKGLTGGFLPLGVTLTSGKIFEQFLSSDPSKTLFHGHSYTANPLACSSALASLELLEKEETLIQIKQIVEKQKSFCLSLKDHPNLRRCESLGTILVLEYKTEHPTSYFHHLRETLIPFFLKHEIFIRPLGNTLYILPPYCMTEAQLEHIHTTIRKTLS